MGKSTVCCDCGIIHHGAVDEVSQSMIGEEEFFGLSAFFSIFADSTRIKILWALDKSELCVCDIASVLGMTKSAVSHQLRVLKEHNLVKNRREGKIIYYSLADGHVKDIFEKAVEHLNE